MRDRKYETTWSSIVAHYKPFIFIIYSIMKLTDKQINLLSIYAKKAKISLDQAIEWVEDWECTVSEISQWLLGTRVN